MLAERWLTILILVVALIFILQNRDRVTITFFTTSFASPMWLVLLITLLVGVVAGVVRTRRRATASER